MIYPETLTSKYASYTGTFSVKEVDITPPVAIYSRNWGASKYDQAAGIHRPLFMQCLVIGSCESQKQFVLLTADLGWWKNAADEHHIRHAILREFRLENHQVLLCLSHTHAGPSLCSNDKDKPGGEHIAPYLDKLKDTAIALIQSCMADMRAGVLTWEYGRCSLATNRDIHVDHSYLVGYNPTRVADDTLLVGCVRDMENKVIATLVNYACHPTTLAHENRLLSPDYVGAMREVVGHDTKAPCLFLQGASGDLAPKEQYVSDVQVADRHGRQLGFSVLSVLEGLLPNHTGLSYQGALESGAPLALWKRTPAQIQRNMRGKVIEIDVELKDLPSSEEIEQEWEHCSDRVMKDRLWRKLNTRRTLGDRQVAKLPLWIWELGDSLIIAQPNEAYSLFQVAVRKTFPGKAIAFINIANGYIGYLPPEELYDNDMYAVWQTPYAKGALERLIAGTTETIKDLQA